MGDQDAQHQRPRQADRSPALRARHRILLARNASRQGDTRSQSRHGTAVRELRPQGRHRAEHHLPPLQRRRLCPRRCVGQRHREGILFRQLRRLGRPVERHLYADPEGMVLRDFDGRHFGRPLRMLLHHQLAVGPRSLLDRVGCGRGRSVDLRNRLQGRKLGGNTRSQELRLQTARRLQEPVFALAAVPRQFRRARGRQGRQQRDGYEPHDLYEPEEKSQLIRCNAG